MKLEVLAAAKGDCLLIHHGSSSDPKLVLIDGGPGGVYLDTLKPRLEELRDKRIEKGLIAADENLFIDLIIVSHIDDDHINGILALLQDMQDGLAPFRVGRIWHNGFDSIVGAHTGQVAAVPAATANMTASIGDSAVSGLSGEEEDTAKILASVRQGHQLLGLARALNVPINPDFAGNAISVDWANTQIIDGLNWTFIGPRESELQELRTSFSKWLTDNPQHNRTTANFIASFTDKSVANLSSIVVLVDDGDQTILLTGDARGDKMMKAAEELELLDEEGTLPVTVLKVPHHGSDNNVKEEFFKMFPAHHYVFCGNGEHGNPERATFEMLAASLPAGRKVKVELNYKPADIDKVRALVWAEHNTGDFDYATQGIKKFLSQQHNFNVIGLDNGD